MTVVSPHANAGCVSPEQASAKIGGTACVRAKVLKIISGDGGSQYLGFCADQARCPFTVAVPANDLRDVGDVRTLVGKTVEVHGPVREADGRAEMVLRDTRQLRGEAAKLPAVPKAYDVEQRVVSQFEFSSESRRISFARSCSSASS